MKLQAKTPQGADLLSLAERAALHFRDDTGEEDQRGEFPFRNLEALKTRRYLYAPIPEEFGGCSVDLVHDVYVASSRLAEGDPSVTLGINMHLNNMVQLARAWRVALASGRKEQAAALTAQMEEIVSHGEVIAAAVSEPNQELTRQATTAAPAEGGWLINGRKIISSMSPAATRFAVSVNVVDEQGHDRYAFVSVPADAPGVTVHDDWNALGMRTSGSSSVSFLNTPVVAGAMGSTFPAGEISLEWLERFITAGPAHASASLGIAESAHAYAAGQISAKRQRGVTERDHLRHLAAENAIDLAAMRGVFARALDLIDAYFAEHEDGTSTLSEAHRVFGDGQAAKQFMTHAAIRVVDRSMTMAGGSAYMSGHPLARHYRDARAAGFMQPLGESLAPDYLGALALGYEPVNF